MWLRAKYYYYKGELLRLRINAKLPRLFRITKYGLITSFAALMLSTSIVVAADETDDSSVVNECSNVKRFIGDPVCSEDGVVPALTSTLVHALNGTMEQETVASAEGDLVVLRYKEGVIGKVNNLMVNTYEGTTNISSVEYIADTIERAGFVQPVNAAETGYRTFSPIIDIWKIFRDIALGFTILSGLGLAVMILLRVRQGQGAVTIMNALPKLIVSIMLILFSYSFAGLLVDFGNIVQRVSVNLFLADGGLHAKFFNENYQRYARDVIPEGSWVYPINECYNAGAGAESNLGVNGCGDGDDIKEGNLETFHLFRLMSHAVNWTEWVDNDTNIADILRTPTNIGIIDNTQDFLSGVGGSDLPEKILELIVSIVVLSGIVKIFFILIRAFAEMVLYTIFAPLVFVAYPVSTSVLSSWIRYFLSNSLLFPGTFFMLFLGALFIGVDGPPWYTRGIVIGGHAPDLLYDTMNQDAIDGSSTVLSKMVGLTIILMAPTLRQFIMQQLRVTENLMIQQAQQSVRNVASKIPFVGGFFNM